MSKIRLFVMALLTMLSFTVNAQTPKPIRVVIIRPREYVEKGLKFLEEGDEVNAVECFRMAAQQGDAQGQDEYGCAFLFGYGGVEQDYKSAYEWIQKSANQGFAEGQRDMGYIYHYGLGVEQDYQKAFEWYSKAAQQGNAHAEKGLGDLYLSGTGVPQNFKEGASWYRKAAEHGDKEAQNILGACYRYGFGVEQDYEKAVEWYRKSAEQGFELGEFNLATMYLDGNGVEKNLDSAIEWYQKAAEQGNENAKEALNEIKLTIVRVLVNGHEVEKILRERAAPLKNDFVYDLGVLLDGEHTCEVVVSNVGYEPLTLERPKIIHGGIVIIDYPKEPIAPGEQVTISFKCNWGKSSGIIILDRSVKISYSVIRNKEDLSIYERNRKKGVLDINNQIIIPFDYDDLKETGAEYKAQRNGKWGVIDRDNRIVIPFDYDEIKSSFNAGYARVKKNGNYYAINKENVLVYELGQSGIGLLLEGDDGSMMYKKGGKYGYIDKNYKILTPAEYDGGAIFEAGCAIVIKNGKWGAIDKNNNVIIPFEYDELFRFQNDFFRAEKNGKWGAVDKNNKIVTPFIYDNKFDVK